MSHFRYDAARDAVACVWAAEKRNRTTLPPPPWFLCVQTLLQYSTTLLVWERERKEVGVLRHRGRRHQHRPAARAPFSRCDLRKVVTFSFDQLSRLAEACTGWDRFSKKRALRGICYPTLLECSEDFIKRFLEPCRRVKAILLKSGVVRRVPIRADVVAPAKQWRSNSRTPNRTVRGETIYSAEPEDATNLDQPFVVSGRNRWKAMEGEDRTSRLIGRGLGELRVLFGVFIAAIAKMPRKHLHMFHEVLDDAVNLFYQDCLSKGHDHHFGSGFMLGTFGSAVGATEAQHAAAIAKIKPSLSHQEFPCNRFGLRAKHGTVWQPKQTELQVRLLDGITSRDRNILRQCWEGSSLETKLQRLQKIKHQSIAKDALYRAAAERFPHARHRVGREVREALAQGQLRNEVDLATFLLPATQKSFLEYFVYAMRTERSFLIRMMSPSVCTSLKPEDLQTLKDLITSMLTNSKCAASKQRFLTAEMRKPLRGFLSTVMGVEDDDRVAELLGERRKAQKQ